MKNRYFKNVATLGLSDERCIGCERCIEFVLMEFSL
jgi:Fe-S-cluster-containing hydrogenase component 2